MNDFILAIDQGSTGTKVLCVDKNGKIIESTYQKIKSYYPKEGWVEHDAEDIWDSVETCLRNLSKKIDFSKIAALGITNQRESTLLWNRKTGESIGPVVSWQCHRSEDICSEWKRAGLESVVREKTGLNIDGYYSASKIKWLLNRFPDTKELIYKDELCFGNINTWIIWKLTSKKEFKTDYSNAARTLLFNIKDLKWDGYLGKLFDIPLEIFPEPVECDGYFGEAVYPEEVFKKKIPILASLGDQQSSLFGQNCFDNKTVKCSFGTCLNLGFFTGGEIQFDLKGIIPTIAWSYKGKINYAVEGGVYVAGSMFDWLMEKLNLSDNIGELTEFAKEVKIENLYLVPAFVGLAAPYWDPKARALLIGLTFNHDKRHIVRAAFESIAFQTNDVLEEEKRMINSDLVIRVDGGMTKNDFLMQILSDYTNCKIERPVNQECTSLGVAYLAGLSHGLWKDLNEIKKLWVVDKTFYPKLNKEARIKTINKWKKAVLKSLSWIE